MYIKGDKIIGWWEKQWKDGGDIRDHSIEEGFGEWLNQKKSITVGLKKGWWEREEKKDE
jgi:hypothetical protein